ncbi:Clavaminate synthase-like protein [Calocera cornea HHB12733]|uniref:Clavaminate synthase-like protein n=1 Tax=Calocera cornea HHB12733 TaxID=1353952 RepID=A0A165HAJ6_9BASI|nr:Clavaminate synthase-like protein [Calocera cornea HHB12733]
MSPAPSSVPSAPAQQIPLIDLSLPPLQIRRAIQSACKDWGFFYLTNHGLPAASVHKLWEVTRTFFALPLEEKAAAGPWNGAENAGYRPVLPKVPKEQFDTRKWLAPPLAGVEAYQQPLPPYLEENRAFLDAFKRECAALGVRVLGYLEEGLGVEEGYFAQRHKYEEPSMDNFELMHYIPYTPEYAEKDVFRLGAHTDWGSLTLLFQESQPGLQVRPPTYDHASLPTASETWIDAPVVQDAVLVNVGDAMHIWSGGSVRSTWHRVSKGGESDRYCAAYFLHPNERSVIDPLPTATSSYIREKYPGFPKTAKQHLHDRVREAVQQQNSALYVG